MSRIKDDQWCFACGPHNPHGLHLSAFRREGADYVVDFLPQRHHQGWQGLTHGGIVATLLDEAMTRLLREAGYSAVTAEMTVRYHRPTPTGEPVQVRARQVAQRGRLVQTEAELLDPQGRALASASGKFMLV